MPYKEKYSMNLKTTLSIISLFSMIATQALASNEEKFIEIAASIDATLEIVNNSSDDFDSDDSDDEEPAPAQKELQRYRKAMVDLLKEGVNVHSRDAQGRTPLIHAAVLGELTVVDLLSDQGANVNAQDEHGNTALIYAVQGGKLEIIEILLNRGASIDMQNKKGATALMYAALGDDDYEGRLAIVLFLLSRGADVHIKNKIGGTAFVMAKSEFNDATAQLLLEHGAEYVSYEEYCKLMEASEKNSAINS